MKKKSEISPRQKTLLLFLSAGQDQEIDPIRIMKGLFLFAMESPREWLDQESRYEFIPYYYGPCSFQIYSDLDYLTEEGYVFSRERPGQSWKYYSLSREGARKAEDLARAKPIDDRAVGYLKAIYDFVSNSSFHHLLTVIYNSYPKYAVNSVFKP